MGPLGHGAARPCIMAVVRPRPPRPLLSGLLGAAAVAWRVALTGVTRREAGREVVSKSSQGPML